MAFLSRRLHIELSPSSEGAHTLYNRGCTNTSISVFVGSMSLHLGTEIFDVFSMPMQDHNHLYIRQGTGLQGQAMFQNKLSFRYAYCWYLSLHKLCLFNSSNRLSFDGVWFLLGSPLSQQQTFLNSTCIISLDIVCRFMKLLNKITSLQAATDFYFNLILN